MGGGIKSHWMSFGFGSTSTNSPFFIHSGSLAENHGKVSIGSQYTSSAILTVDGNISSSGHINLENQIKNISIIIISSK